MKNVTIPLEFFIQLENIFNKEQQSKNDQTKEDMIIDINKKYFNHIGLA
mgnify:CR=1 FL=1